MQLIIKKVVKIFTTEQFKKYFISGITAFGVDFSTLNFLIYILKYNEHIKIIVPLSVSNLISSLIGMIISFTLNRFFAFKSKKSIVKEGGKFLTVVIINYIISNALFGIIVNLGVIEPITKVLVIGLQMFWTYFLYKSFVFKDPSIIVTD